MYQYLYSAIFLSLYCNTCIPDTTKMGIFEKNTKAKKNVCSTRLLHIEMSEFILIYFSSIVKFCLCK